MVPTMDTATATLLEAQALVDSVAAEGTTDDSSTSEESFDADGYEDDDSEELIDDPLKLPEE